ncbi:MAG: DMT family transporter [Fusobacteria bacterium]|nr:DMT family transporter [Fusobacteriota bacterium]
MEKNLFGSISIMISAALWGASGILFIPHLSNLSASFASLLQGILSLLILTVLFSNKLHKILRVRWKDFSILLLIALFAGFLGSVAIVKALFLTGFSGLSIVVLLQKLQPLFAVLLAMIFLKERPSKKYFIWFAIVLISGYFLAFGWHIPEFSLKNKMLVADSLSVFAAFCFASNTVFGRYLSQEIAFETISYYRAFLSTIMILVYCMVLPHSFFWSGITLTNIKILLLIVFFAGPFTLLLYYHALKYVKASIATLCELSMPITAVVLDYIVNHAHYSCIQWTSAIIMVVGLYFITRIQLKSR